MLVNPVPGSLCRYIVDDDDIHYFYSGRRIASNSDSDHFSDLYFFAIDIKMTRNIMNPFNFHLSKCYIKPKYRCPRQFSTSFSNSEEGNGKIQRPIYVAATKQHAGKTTTSLALISGLTKRFGKVGFMKPVGQQHVPVRCSNGDEVRVDKDVSLIKEYFNLSHLDYRHMSPVIIPRGRLT